MALAARCPWFAESLPRIWARRSVTIPALHVATIVVIALLPLALLVAAIVDLIGDRRGVSVRTILALTMNLLMHCAGVWLLFASALLGGDWTRRFEVWWVRGAYRTMARLFHMKMIVEGADAIPDGPFLLFARHSSIVDPLLPVVLIAGPRHRRVRWVAKRRLLLDPCVDIVGHRMPMAFVRRGTARHGPEIASVVKLLDALDPNDIVLLYPEGTRFTERKRARFLAQLEQKDPESHARASRIENLLPPHIGGLLGLLEQNPGLDVVFCANTGLERAGHLRDLFAGALLDANVRVAFWREPFDEIPKTRAERIDWFYGWWTHLDRWIAERRTEWTIAGNGVCTWS